MMNHELENPVISPKRDNKRLIALDAARGLAVIGMFIQHFALNQGNSFVSGNTMILFMLCSGISYSIMAQRMTERKTEPAVLRARILARAVFIDFVGYVLIMLNGPFGVVLPAYAMLFILALPLIHRSTRTLFTLSCILFLAGPPLMISGLSLFSGAALLSDIAGGPLSALGWAPIFVLGMVVGRLDLHRTQTALRFIAVGFAVLIPSKLFAYFVLPGISQSFEAWLIQVSNVAATQVDPYAIWPLNTQIPPWQMLFEDAPQGGSAFELIIGMGLSMIILGILCLIEKKSTGILKPFSAVGRVALTLYALQFAIVWGLQIAGINIMGINIGAIPFGDVFVAAATLITGCLLNYLPNGPLETWIRRFERLFA